MSKRTQLAFTVLITILVLLVANGAALAAAPAIRVFLSENELIFDDAPYEENGRIFVPIRALSEAVEARVTWEPITRTVVINREADELVLTIGSTAALYNGVKIPMDAAPFIKNGHTFLPLRFVSEWLRLQVNYEAGVVRMTRLPSLTAPETMEAHKGNYNGNLNWETPENSFRPAIIWQDKLYRRHPYWDCLCAKDLITNEEKAVESCVSPKYFNIWQDMLYANVGGNFVQLDAEGNILLTVQENVDYCQIHDGWLYFLRENDRQLCRRLLGGGDAKALGIFASFPSGYSRNPEFVITDQHIIVNDGCSILRTSLSGSNRVRLLNVFSPERYYISGLEYSNGKLYFSFGGNTSESMICQINLDGTGLKELVHDGADQIIAVGDWLYYTKLGDYGNWGDQPNGDVKVGVSIARVKLDGSGKEVMTDTAGRTHSPTLMPDGSIFYCESTQMEDDIWVELER